jgi:CheY-like chemotaxis protein
MNQPKQKHILVADDEINTLDTLGFILESANYEVDLVENGKEALIKILSAKDTGHPVDLLITDIRMPVLSGFELINKLRQFTICIPILIITSYDSKDLKEQVQQSGITEYLTKPFGDQELLSTIDNIFQKNQNYNYHKNTFI